MSHVNKVDRFVYTDQMTTKTASPSARDRILTKAHDLFYQDGIRATGIDRIIKEAGVTKVTFYRHFPSKFDLIQAYLEYRHDYWMSWFKNAVERHKKTARTPQAVILRVLTEWFQSESFRGCAFINAVVELDGVSSNIAELTRMHKLSMASELREHLLSSDLMGMENAVAMAIDGAIIQAQIDSDPNLALITLKQILSALSNSSK